MSIYFISFFLRLHSLATSGVAWINSRAWSRILLGWSLAAYYFRILRFFAVFPFLGPKMVMLRGMLIKDFGVFALFTTVALLAYGFASQALLDSSTNPNAPGNYLVGVGMVA